jgi:hypothetical protein
MSAADDSSVDRAFLRHAVATLAYRGMKVGRVGADQPDPNREFD